MNDHTDHPPLTDQRLDEIENLLSVVTRNRVTTFVERDEADAHWFVHSAKYATELISEIRRLRIDLATAISHRGTLKAGFEEVCRERDDWRNRAEAALDEAGCLQAEILKALAGHDKLTRLLEIERQKTDSVRLLAEQIRRYAEWPGITDTATYPEVVESLRACATGLIRALGMGRPQDARHFSPGYQGEIPDHHGPADTCAMPACVTARAQHEAADRIQDLTYELLAGREPKAGA